MFERSLTFAIDVGKQVFIQLQFDDAHKVVNLYASVDGGQQSHAKWVFNPSTKFMEFSVVAAGVSQTACILSCLGIAVGKPLLECLLNSGSVTEVEQCLRGKAVGALADAVLCVAHCLGLVP